MAYAYKKKFKKTLFNLKVHRLNCFINNAYIIAYHRIVDTPFELYPDMSIKVFERQIRHLSENYNIVPVTEIADRIIKGKNLKGLVGLTFDDGFKDNYTHAYPILKKYNAPATIFLISECIETGNAPWFLLFRQAFLNTVKLECDLQLGHQLFSFSLKNIKERKIASDQVMSFLQKSKNHERLEYLDIIYDVLEPFDSDELSNIMLNWDQVLEMSNNGVRFGAHTHTHPVLSSLSVKDAEKEITKSKAIIENRIGTIVNEFAYPVGKKIHYSKELFPVLKKNGFKYSVTTQKGKITQKSNLYELSRPYPWELNAITL